MSQEESSPLAALAFLDQCIGSVELQIIPKGSSLYPLWRIIEELKLPPERLHDEVAVFFDMDGTLTNVGPPMLKKTVDERLRGGAESRKLMQALNENGIRWFVLSARAATRSAMQGVGSSLYGMDLPSPDWSYADGANCYQGRTSDGGYRFEPVTSDRVGLYDDKVYNSIECNNMISLVEPGEEYAFAKDISLEYALHKFFQVSPSLLIFVDDNAKNVMQVYMHFKHKLQLQHGSCDHPERVICVLYDPQRKEADHDEWKTIMDEEMQILAQ